MSAAVFVQSGFWGGNGACLVTRSSMRHYRMWKVYLSLARILTGVLRNASYRGDRYGGMVGCGAEAATGLMDAIASRVRGFSELECSWCIPRRGTSDVSIRLM
jgi:hypothetical protein